MTIRLFAEPWWVNLLIFVPFLCYAGWRKSRLDISTRPLLFAFLFAVAFGIAESAVVVYLRAAAGLLPGLGGALSDVQRLAPRDYIQSQSISQFPPSLLTVEVLRESATMVMLLATAALAHSRLKECFAFFVWEFATWDLAYYAGLWLLVRWPTSLKSLDVLFLIPRPWISQVWFPLLVSSLSLIAVAATCSKSSRSTG
ncbi:MAG TPA: hypothetical protein VFA68_18110 [Terriglobales bacterium]|nr:hypothetical protein [Terriglobales bacterium]